MNDANREWVLTLRNGMPFHDDTPVLARDVLASLQRWGELDSFGAARMAAADELSAPTDKTVRFRVEKAVSAIGGCPSLSGANAAVIMPARLASTDW